MKNLFLLLSPTLINSKKLIKNINIPSCKNCIHYKPSYTSTDFTSSFNKCSMFGDKNIITDKITLSFADFCRNDENKCGHEGKYFEENKNIALTIFLHQIISNIPNILLVSVIVTSITANILISKKL